MTLPLKLAQIHPQQWMINSEGPAQGISDDTKHQHGCHKKKKKTPARLNIQPTLAKFAIKQTDSKYPYFKLGQGRKCILCYSFILFNF